MQRVRREAVPLSTDGNSQHSPKSRPTSGAGFAGWETVVGRDSLGRFFPAYRHALAAISFRAWGVVFWWVALVLSAAGQSATVTTLAVTSGGSVVTTVKQGSLVTLTATVTVGGSRCCAAGAGELLRGESGTAEVHGHPAAGDGAVVEQRGLQR